jgi:hypothetical protein
MSSENSAKWYVENTPRLRKEKTFLVEGGDFINRRTKRSIVQRPKVPPKIKGITPVSRNAARKGLSVRKDIMKRTPIKRNDPLVLCDPPRGRKTPSFYDLALCPSNDGTRNSCARMTCCKRIRSVALAQIILICVNNDRPSQQIGDADSVKHVRIRSLCDIA